MSWKAQVIYDADGTKKKEFFGHNISAQIFPGTNTFAIIVSNDNNEVIETFQGSKVWTISRIKVEDE